MKEFELLNGTSVVVLDNVRDIFKYDNDKTEVVGYDLSVRFYPDKSIEEFIQVQKVYCYVKKIKIKK